MSSIMHILGWRARGLRCPDHEVDCSDTQDTPLPVILIQMPNGTGKTTTLSLLRAALSGSADKHAWPRSRVLTYQKRDHPHSEGLFELRLLLNGQRVTIILEFDFESGRIYYKTTRGHGQVDGFDPPMEFRRFMNEEFVKFFVFDGELADNILSREHTDAQQAVESLFQVHLLPQMESKVSAYWDEQTRSVTAKDQAGYTRRTNRLRKWRDRLSDLQQERAVCQEELESVSQQLRIQQERYNSEIKKEEERAGEIRSAERASGDAEDQVKESTQGVLDGIRDPHAVSPTFAESMYGLKMGLDRVKLPESAAREFFEELSEEDLCVCGRPIDEDIKNAIKDRARQYLSTDDVSLLNAMKTAIEESVGASRTDAAETLTQNISALDALVNQELTARNELDRLRRDAERSDPDVMRAKEEIDRLSALRTPLREKLTAFDAPEENANLDHIGNLDPNRISSIATVEKVVSLLEDQVSEITGTLALRRKRDLLNGVVQQAYTSARQQIANEIKDDANDRIAELMPNNSIRIDEIDRSVGLSGQTTGSAGENLSVGYAFLATLFNRSGEHELPFVVDSPANPIDYDIRPKIGGLAPKLTNQFIAFVISSERERFLPALRSEAEGNILYITLFRKNITHHAQRAQAVAGHVESADGLLVVDEDFFNDFQLDAEEDD